MLDHRLLLLISLLAAFLSFNAVAPLFQHPTAASSRLVPIEVEPDVTSPDARGES